MIENEEFVDTSVEDAIERREILCREGYEAEMEEESTIVTAESGDMG